MATRTISNSGGTRNWNDTATWVEGAVPTNADDVVGTATSGPVSVNVATAMRSLDLSAYTNTLTATSGFGLIVDPQTASTVVCKFSAAMTLTMSGTVALTLRGVAGSQINLTSAGKQPLNLSVGFANAGYVQFQDAFTTTGGITLTSGTLDTNGKAVSAALFNANNTNTKALTLGASTITLTGVTGWTIDGTNTTFNAGTSTIALSTGTQTFAGGGLTYNNVTFTFSGTTLSITGANTFTNFTLTGGSNTTNTLSLFADQTVTGTFSLSGTSVTRRPIVQSDTVGVARTLRAAAVSLTDVDFRDIAATGAAAPFTGTRLGDAQGNSGITFTTKTVNYVGGSTNRNWDTSAVWATSSGGAGSVNNFPLPQDTAVIDGNSGTNTLTINYPRLGSVDASAANNVTITTTTTFNMYGSWDLRGVVSAAIPNGVTVMVRTVCTLRHGGKFRIAGALTLNSPGGTLQLLDDLVAGTFSLTTGTFDANNKNVTTGSFSSSNTNTRTITMGSGTWTLTGTGTIWTTNLGVAGNNLTYNPGTAKIIVADTSTATKTWSSGTSGLAIRQPDVVIPAGRGDSGAFIMGGGSYFKSLTVGASNTINVSGTSTVDTFVHLGYSGNPVVLQSSAAGTRRVVTLTNTSSGDYLTVKDIQIVGALYAGANGVDGGNNLTVGSTLLFQKGPRPAAVRSAASRASASRVPAAHAVY